MESLLALVDKIQQVSPLPIFTKEVFIVQNAGMQHWLSMSLANKRGVHINIDYALPAQYLWKLLRNLVNTEENIDQAPFSREALCWRIYQLLADEKVCQDDYFLPVTQYWQTAKSSQISTQDLTHSLSNDSSLFSAKENVKRYQLSCQLADLFEQYLVFRPDWIDSWQHDNLIATKSVSDNFDQAQKWQAKLWQLLTAEQAYNPLALIQSAIEKLPNAQSILPKRICFFGINAMAPMWLSFINQLSEVTQVHFFHLNPCFNYWGDIVSEKQAIKLLDKWTDNHQAFSESVGNPLLANLGQQGREFLALLQQYSTINIDAFSENVSDSIFNNLNSNSNLRDEEANEVSDDISVLQHIQNDILTLTDAREDKRDLKDDSIIITSAHSALREVQGLHDWLLHQFNQDPSLTPKDILVMCPQVEQYAPYVNAVFAQGWQDLDNNIPPLPCSIADRVSKDSDPLVAAFSQLLTLPDSRFHVSQILAWLRIPAMQTKFDLPIDDLEKLSVWIEHAAIHWGVNHQHKSQILQSEKQSEQFTWQYGLSRLLQGFAYSDQQALYDDKLVLPDVEGSDALLLGKLMLVIEQLQFFTQELNQARTPQQWHTFLYAMISDLFDDSLAENFSAIYQAIDALVEYCHQAQFEQVIDLAIIREFLDNHFSQPDPGRQFMVGQVTFCSMLPMRSIPFKIVAVLGLNDGEFPRQRTPMGFDLMSMSEFRLGDRSRRGDDRYLFLEALISARQTLYLSYQGRNIKNNNEKQPSIVLKELMDYLATAYGWQLIDNSKDIRQLPMQPYSEKNYQGKFAGFDEKWLALYQRKQDVKNQFIDNQNKVNHVQTNEGNLLDNESSKITDNDLVISPAQMDEQKQLDVIQLIRFYQHPARYFAQNHLSLYLDSQETQLSDDEPFNCDSLVSYLFKQEVLEPIIHAKHSFAQNSELLTNESLNHLSLNIEELYQSSLLAAKRSGKFPDLPNSDEMIGKLFTDSQSLADFIYQKNADNAEELTITLPITFHQADMTYHVELVARMQVKDQQIVTYRASTPKAKDFLNQYVQLLVVQVWLLQQNMSETESDVVGLTEVDKLQPILTQINASHGYYFDTKAQKAVHYCYLLQENPLEKLKTLIEGYFLGQQQALLLNGELAEKFFKARLFEQEHFEKLWCDDHNGVAFGKDPYLQYFWPTPPQLSAILPMIEKIYSPVFNACQQVKS